MDDSKAIFEAQMSQEQTAQIIKSINRYCGEATITSVRGSCPYGHREGETFQISAMNHAGMCGALWHIVQPGALSLQYGGAPVWEKDGDRFKALCPEMGTVSIEVCRREKQNAKTLTTRPPLRDMTGRGYPALDKYRLFVEILGVERHCMWAHKEGQRFEVDPFNIGRACGSLYWGAYHFIELLFAGGCVPWEAQENIIHGACPDIYNQTIYRLVREDR